MIGTALPQECGNAEQQAAEPGETSLKPMKEARQHLKWMRNAWRGNLKHLQPQLRKILQLVPYLRAGYTNDHDDGNDDNGIGRNCGAEERTMQYVGCGNCREPHKNAEGSEGEGAQVKIREHVLR